MQPTREQEQRYKEYFRISAPAVATKAEIARILRQAEQYLSENGDYIELSGLGIENVPSVLFRKTGIRFPKHYYTGRGVLEAALGLNSHIVSSLYEKTRTFKPSK